MQIADVPGRDEPGSGDIDRGLRLSQLRSAGYDGPIGLEYVPTGPTIASLQSIRTMAHKPNET